MSAVVFCHCTVGYNVSRRSYFHYRDAEPFHSSSPSRNLETTTETDELPSLPNETSFNMSDVVHQGGLSKEQAEGFALFTLIV